MQWRNSSSHYGLVSILLHWLVALAVFGLFGLGYWMVGLDYYSGWYKTAPDLHKSIGLLLFAVMLVRVLWRWVSPAPASLPNHGRLTRLGSKLGHGFLYLGLFVLMISGAPETNDDRESERVLQILLDDGLAVSQAARLAHAITGASKNALYERALSLKKSESA